MLELKHYINRRGNTVDTSFNRTMLELKQDGIELFGGNFCGFNRTMLELKLRTTGT